MEESMITSDRVARLRRAAVALHGLSVGDAFGEQFFVASDVAELRITTRTVPTAPWPYTDDTEMSLSVIGILRRYGLIEQDALASLFATHYDPSRGYGPAMHRTLTRIASGEYWSGVAGSAFDGQGSHGNGGAMRSAPIGAYFADDPDMVAAQATRAAEVTHAHAEGISGAVAVAVAAALAVQARAASSQPPEPRDFLDQLLAHVPRSEVHSRLRRARDLSERTPVQSAVAVLGNGTGLSAQDTVPFALWCTARHLGDFPAALWLTVSGLGDRDTTCAITGGVVACFTGMDGIPADWLLAREPLPDRLTPSQ
jgi:ADP-ribosylglycohydrolase